MADAPSEFELASRRRQRGLVAEVVLFIRTNKKFWLVPLILVLLLFAGILALAGTVAAPFIYTFF